ncbi:MAG: ABC transporter permease [Gemmatimonadota bacterium]
MLRDLRFACRALMRSPVFILAAVLTLAFGIGATTSVFSLLNAVQFGVPRFTDSESLVDIHEASATRLCAGCAVGTSSPGYHDWREQAHSFVAMSPYLEDRFVLSGDHEAERVSGAYTGADLFPLLGVTPLLGRGMVADDDRVGAVPVVLVSHGLWQRRFGSDSTLPGRIIKVNGMPHTIIGVMPAKFKFPEKADLWVPFEGASHSTDRSDRSIGVAARLKPGIALTEANAEMRGIAAGLATEYPAEQKEWTAEVALLRSSMAGDTGDYFWVLLGGVSLVLLATCASLAGLFLARATGRRKEMALRAALGASRGRLVRQMLTESVVVSLLGGTGGLLLSWWATDLAAAGFREEAPYWVTFGVDGRVLAFCFGVSILTGLVFGAGPALRASRPDLNASLKEGGTTTTPGRTRQRFRSTLVVVEFALALVLLNGAGLMIKTFLRVAQPPSGFDMKHLLLGEVEFIGSHYADTTEVLRATARILQRLNAAPGVHASGSNAQFIAGFGATDQKILVEGLGAVPENASPRFSFAVTPGYFQVFGLKLMMGRDFESRDDAGSAPVAIVNHEMARRLWPGESGLGKRLKLGNQASTRPWVTVVGIVSNEEGESGPGREAAPYAYVPLSQSPDRPIHFMVRTAGDPMAMAPSLRSAVREVDPDLPVEEVRSAEASHIQRYWHVRLYAVFFFGFAVFALLLAAIGIYGIVAQTVSQRTHEIGIRVALGAERLRVLRLIVGDGARLAGLGLLIGLAGALTLTRLMSSMLFNTSPVDLRVLIPVAVLLFVVALVASWLPARRALRVDPIQALRTE